MVPECGDGDLKESSDINEVSIENSMTAHFTTTIRRTEYDKEKVKLPWG